MIGSPSRSAESPSEFPSGALLTQKELDNRGISNDRGDDSIKKVILDGAEHYCILPETRETPKRQKIALFSRNRLISTPEQRQLAALSRKLQEEKDRLRKLKMLEKNRVENADLNDVTGKWRDVAQEALAELKSRMNVRSRNILGSIGIPYKHLDLELSSCCSNSDEDDEQILDGSG